MEDVKGLMIKVIKNLNTSKNSLIDTLLWIRYGYAMLDNFQNDTSAKLPTCKNNLALALRTMAQLYRGPELIGEPLMLTRRILIPSHPETAESYSNLALVLNDMGIIPEPRGLP